MGIKSTTERFRDLLDERGVKWRDGGNKWNIGDGVYQERETVFELADGREAKASEMLSGSLCLSVRLKGLTPEQAIAATLENDPYDAVSCEHVISSDTLHLILDEWDVHPGWTATNENMAQLFGYTAATLGSDSAPFLVWDDTGHLLITMGGLKTWDVTDDAKTWFATLGGGNLTADQVRETVEKHWHDLPADYDMPEATALPEYSYDWQAIADELNIALGNGECELTNYDMTSERMLDRHWVYDSVYKCSKCGETFGHVAVKHPKFCPECGRKAVKR